MPQHFQSTMLDDISRHCACFTLRRGARAITQLYDRALAPTGVRATQFTLLVALARAGAIPFTRLAGVLGMERTTLTRNAAPLERDGLLTIGPGADRRVKLVRITGKGRKALALAIPRWEEAQRQITGGIGPARWDAVRREIHRITRLAGDPDAASRATSLETFAGGQP
jgi:DNA-binding MarR family transcriptional regulator